MSLDNNKDKSKLCKTKKTNKQTKPTNKQKQKQNKTSTEMRTMPVQSPAPRIFKRLMYISYIKKISYI